MFVHNVDAFGYVLFCTFGKFAYCVVAQSTVIDHDVAVHLLYVTVYVFAFPFAVSVVFCVIVTVVAFVVALAGSFPLFFVQFTHEYPSDTVASILTCFPYLYVCAAVVLVHPLFTALIHVHLFNVNVYVLLANHILYVLFAVNVGALLFTVAAVVLGSHVLTHLNVVLLAHVGIV